MARIDDIMRSSDVVRRVVEARELVVIYTVVLQQDMSCVVPVHDFFSGRPQGGFACQLVQYSWQEMVLQLR